MFRFTKEHPKQTISEQFVGICMGILLIFALFIGLFLAFYSVRYSYYTPSSCIGPVQPIKDSPFINILFFTIAALLLPVLNKLFQKLGNHQKKAGYFFMGLCCLIYVTMCLIWVSELPYYPSGDQLIATAAAHYHLDGNFTMLANGGYLGQYPFQKGLTILYELLFTIFGDFCYSVAAKFHIGMGVITLITGYLFVEETSHNNICKIIYCLLFLFCAPYIILTPYIYGDLPSICLCTVLFWALLRFARTENKLYIILCCITASLSLMVRTHTWIVLIAVFIGMFLVALQKKLLAPILAAALIITSAFATQNAVNYSYLLRSGFPSTYGAPMVLWIAMGTQNNEDGPGSYNNYQSTVLSEADFNRDVAAEIGKKNLQENLQHFTEDTDYAIWFFKTKLQMQWIEPTFETLLSTYSFDEDVLFRIGFPKSILAAYMTR